MPTKEKIEENLGSYMDFIIPFCLDGFEEFSDFEIREGDYASISCYDWSKEMKYADHLRVSFITKEYKNWIIELSSNP